MEEIRRLKHGVHSAALPSHLATVVCAALCSLRSIARRASQAVLAAGRRCALPSLVPTAIGRCSAELDMAEAIRTSEAAQAKFALTMAERQVTHSVLGVQRTRRTPVMQQWRTVGWQRWPTLATCRPAVLLPAAAYVHTRMHERTRTRTPFSQSPRVPSPSALAARRA